MRTARCPASPYGFLTPPYGSPYGSDFTRPNVYKGPYGFAGPQGGKVPVPPCPQTTCRRAGSRRGSGRGWNPARCNLSPAISYSIQPATLRRIWHRLCDQTPRVPQKWQSAVSGRPSPRRACGLTGGPARCSCELYRRRSAQTHYPPSNMRRICLGRISTKSSTCWIFSRISDRAESSRAQSFSSADY